jgi:hypothetical protein
MSNDTPRNGAVVARMHGAFNIASGVWPLLHRRSFEAVFGPKDDYWLAATVALLLAGNETVQLIAPPTPGGLASARRIGMATAAVLASVDVVNVAIRSHVVRDDLEHVSVPSPDSRPTAGGRMICRCEVAMRAATS